MFTKYARKLIIMLEYYDEDTKVCITHGKYGQYVERLVINI